MIVRELIDLLKNLDPEAFVILGGTYSLNKPLEANDFIIRSIHFTKEGSPCLCTEEQNCPNCYLHGRSRNGFFLSHDFSVGV